MNKSIFNHFNFSEENIIMNLGMDSAFDYDEYIDDNGNFIAPEYIANKLPGLSEVLDAKLYIELPSKANQVRLTKPYKFIITIRDEHDEHVLETGINSLKELSIKYPIFAGFFHPVNIKCEYESATIYNNKEDLLSSF